MSTAADDFNVVTPTTNPSQTAADDFNVVSSTTGGGSGSIVNLVATALDGAVRLTWTPPGGTVTSYQVIATSGGSVRRYTLPGTDTTDTLLQLTNGLSWDIEMSAVTAAGTSAPVGTFVSPSPSLTTPSSGVRPDPGTPDPPTISSVLAGDRGATISWNAPAYAGGNLLTGFRVVASDTARIFPQVTLDLTNSVATFANLALINGVTYAVTVQARNALGFSAASNTMLVSPSSGGPVIDPTPPPLPPPVRDQSQPIFYAFPSDQPFAPASWLAPQGA